MMTEASKPKFERERPGTSPRTPDARNKGVGRDGARPLRICLAGSGGGHLRQLLDLAPAWTGHDYFFVTEDTALARSLAEQHPVHYVPHFALGQAKLGAPLQMVKSGWLNFIESGRIVRRERPDLVISTGAGSALFTVAWARLLRAKIVIVESFARFTHLSAFSRLAAPFAHKKVVQSAALSSFWPDAAVFDPLRILSTPRPEKRRLLFATVGATLPFDRMIATVAELKAQGEIPEDVLMQVGIGGLAPEGFDTVETLTFEQMLASLEDADVVVCHGGTGSLITALRAGCRVIAMPRLYSRGEHYDDHQEDITRAFADRGLIALANSPMELSAALKAVREQTPVIATSDPTELVDYLNYLIKSGWVQPRSSRG